MAQPQYRDVEGKGQRASDEEGALAPVFHAYNSFCRSNICEDIKLVLWSIAVSLLILVLLVGVANHYSILPSPAPVNFVIMILSLILVAYLESLHYACVSVEKWDMTPFAERFPRAVKCQKLVDTPKKVKKFLVGRQFFLLFNVFLLGQITTFPTIPHNFAGLPAIFILILIQTGLPGVFLTLTVGQLISQIYVEEFTLQFLNLPGCEFCIRLSLFAEYIGVCNFSWLLFFIVSRLLCRKVRKIQKSLDSMKASGKHSEYGLENGTGHENGELDPMSPTEKNRPPDYDSGIPDEPLGLFDYAKYIWSTCVTLGSVSIICWGISKQAYVLPTPIPVAYLLAIILLTLLFYLEGLMIAIVGTQYWDPETFRHVYPRAYKIHRLVNQPENVKRFIIGRQFCTVLTNFLLNQIFTFKTWSNHGFNKVLFYIGVQSGLVGVFTVLAFAQLLPELLAAEFPLRFLDNYGAFTIVRISLFFDSIGIGHAAWSIYYVTRAICCGKHMEEGKVSTDSKQTLVRVTSAEVLAKTSK